MGRDEGEVNSCCTSHATVGSNISFSFFSSFFFLFTTLSPTQLGLRDGKRTEEPCIYGRDICTCAEHPDTSLAQLTSGRRKKSAGWMDGRKKKKKQKKIQKDQKRKERKTKKKPYHHRSAPPRGPQLVSSAVVSVY